MHTGHLIVYKSSGKEVPDRMLEHYIDNPELAKEKLENKMRTLLVEKS